MTVYGNVQICPDLFELSIENSNEKRWVLIVSIGDNPKFEVGSRTQYFVGSFDGSTFVAENGDIRWLDFGKDNYAGVSFSDIPKEDGRRIYLGWMSNWRYANEVPTEGWRSQMTLPRELTLRETNGGTHIVQKVVRELDEYFTIKKEVKDLSVGIKNSNNYEMNAEYAEVELILENIDACRYGLTIHHTATQSTTITIDAGEKLLFVDRKESGNVDFSSNFSQTQKIKLEGTKRNHLRVIVDSSSLELFMNDGEKALTSLLYPDQACASISLFATEGQVNVIHGKFSIPSNE